MGKESACTAGDLGLIPGSGRSPREGNDNPLQYSCLENLMNRGAWQATVCGVARIRHDLATKPPPPQMMSLSDLSLWHLAISLSLLAGTGVQIWCLAKFLENLKVWLQLQVNQLPSGESRFYNQSENLELRFQFFFFFCFFHSTDFWSIYCVQKVLGTIKVLGDVGK